ncbi:MAG: hypothetical protein JW994_03620 [Candidatus Omnitrophica bacterium]|nr:hypothetical protein [Candidatus Omnitrophota bacterium]
MKKIREHLKKNRNLVNIFFVYFFLAFVIGYIDFDRRVLPFKESTATLKRVVERTAVPPLARRPLVPFTVYFMHKVSHLPLEYTYALFRLFFFILAFCLFHVYLRLWFDDRLAMIGTLSVIASLPLFLTNWISVFTDMPNFVAFILGTMWIKQNRHRLLYILIPIATLNKEAIVAIVVLYFLYNTHKEKPGILARRIAIMLFLWAAPYVWTIVTFGLQTFTDNGASYLVPCTVKHNIKGLLAFFKNPHPYNHYYFLIYLLGFYWVLAFRNFSRKDELLKKSIIVMALYSFYVFWRVGAINEVRVFIPFYVYIIPLGLFSLFEKKEVE